LALSHEDPCYNVPVSSITHEKHFSNHACYVSRTYSVNQNGRAHLVEGDFFINVIINQIPDHEQKKILEVIVPSFFIASGHRLC
jgi:hypothetical protein